jgi:hypothetical protein
VAAGHRVRCEVDMSADGTTLGTVCSECA